MLRAECSLFSHLASSGVSTTEYSQHVARNSFASDLIKRALSTRTRMPLASGYDEVAPMLVSDSSIQNLSCIMFILSGLRT